MTQAALADAEGIVAWIADRGRPEDARRWFDALLRALGGLAQYPERHPHAFENPELAEAEIRHLVFGGYRALYTIRDQRVIVVHIRHGKRRSASREQLVRRLEEADPQDEERRAERESDGGE